MNKLISNKAKENYKNQNTNKGIGNSKSPEKNTKPKADC